MISKTPIIYIRKEVIGKFLQNVDFFSVNTKYLKKNII